jgi:PBSX family phage terminase large subunit
MSIGRYNLHNKKDQARAKYDAQIEAARREKLRRDQVAISSVVAPTFRGAALELQSILGKHFEVIIKGPAETGKTFAACYFIDWVLRTYPHVQAVLARKVRDTIVPTVLQTYLKIVADKPDVVSYGGKKPEWFEYSNGSRLWLAGLDDPGKALSSERDIVYINQCEEVSIHDWETLTTRVTGRAGNLPNGMSLMLGDANPSHAKHWTTQRSSVYVMRSFHKDNPTLYSDDGKPTERGNKTLGILSNLSEPRRSRLFLGLDVSAEGQVYKEYDNEKHLITRFDIPNSWPCIRVVDFGFTNPFVCSWYCFDRRTSRIYRYREIYQTQVLVEDHARKIAECEGWEYDTKQQRVYWHRPIEQRENIIATICDHDAEDRATLTRYGIPNIAAFKAIKLGIEAVQNRLRYRIDTDDYGLYFLQDSLIETDQALKDAYLPTCTEEEIEGYVWEQGKDGKPAKEQPIDKNNHGMDVLRYAVAFVDNIDIELDETPQRVEYEEDYEISPI